MAYSSAALVAIGLGLFLPLSVNAQQTTPSTSASGNPAQVKSAEKGLQTGQPNESPSATRSQAADSKDSGQTLISVQSLNSVKILDTEQKEVGTLKNLMIDPQDGKLVRADVSMGGGGVLGVGGGERRVSIPWDQVSIKRRGKDLVLVLNQEIVDKVKAPEEKQTAERNQKAQQPSEAK